ncbi:hypothetical protein TPHA_0O00260 [Tetrapisispora phaffii CBS 4417]|uniref:Flavodoxin-like domain-containing protein n=1 Tax=Tetrapisispora phaffii (strain ATCC 24235 / CBS 4417 / NBRC 1672 / NRRL Y-8282 / UCD 70-5) TaxID=1071381 RepID=G8C1H0_TETPH|nr:hypothetical protein TPHA_0O00260 [Tetrapisispora phaffii CBS 4417]CCE65998.1 hypothetical protein TPHA_0O00260 [Tetrapisispora phaffii CBS 4417]
MTKIAIITYSTYGHVDTLAKEIQKSIQDASKGFNDDVVDLFRLEETLSDDVLQAMHAPEKDASVPVIKVEDLINYDAFVFGIPTRFGSAPAQWLHFWDQTSSLWAQGQLYGKMASFFLSSGTYGGGLESTVRNTLSYLVHHGIIYVPLGYKNAFAELSNTEEVHGGTPWGATTLADTDGSRQPSDLELRIANIQGKTFYETVKRFAGESTEVQKKEKKTKITALQTVEKQAKKKEEKKEESKNFLTACCTLM